MHFRNKRFIQVFTALLIAACFSANVSLVHAQSVSQGLSISPFLLERQMDKGQSENELIDITNTSDQTLPITISVNDFIPVGTTGEEQFVAPGQGDPHYSLSSWITITSDPKPVLSPGEKTSVAFTITVPQNAEDGGHYGAILFSFQAPQAQGSAVSIAQKIGAIILVKTGKVNEAGEITLFSADKSFSEYPPVSFTTMFKNLGNVHVAPRGNIIIKNMFGKEIASVLVNENANNVLPNTERQFAATWKDSFGFGPYSATEKLVYGDSGQVAVASTTFWVIPWKITLVVALALFLLILLIVWLIRRYNRWLLRQAYARQPVRRK